MLIIMLTYLSQPPLPVFPPSKENSEGAHAIVEVNERNGGFQVAVAVVAVIVVVVVFFLLFFSFFVLLFLFSSGQVRSGQVSVGLVESLLQRSHSLVVMVTRLNFYFLFFFSQNLQNTMFTSLSINRLSFVRSYFL